MTIQKATREGYKLSLYVYRCVRTIVQSGSGIPWIVLDKKGEQIPNHPFEMVMKRPNPEMSGQDLNEYLIAHLKLVGNALWQPIIVRGQVAELWPVMPDMVKPIPSKTPGQWLDGYEVTEATGRSYIKPPETFIHFMQFDPGNPYWGIGDLQSAGRTIDTDNEAQDTQKVSMQNRGVPSGIFKYTDVLTEEQFEEQNRRIQEIYLEKSKRRAPWVLGGGADWQAMGMSPVEMDYVSSRLSNKRDIAAAFGVDPWWLGDKEASTYNNVSEARKALYETVVLPLLDDVKSTLNLKIAPMYGDVTITYDTTNITALRDDYGKKVDQAARLWAMGVPMQQINDKLEMGLDEFDGWDNGYLPFSVAPVGSGQPAEEVPATDEPVKKKSLDSEEQKFTYWKRIDSRRMAYVPLIQKKVIALYKQEADAVINAIDNEKSIKASPEDLADKAKRAIEGLQKAWIALLTATGLTLIEDFGAQTAADIGSVFSPTTDRVKEWLRKHAAESVTSIASTNLDEVRAVIVKGAEDGLTNRQIATQLREFYEDRSVSKAMRVARTEIASAAGFGQHESAKQGGKDTHKWLSSRDDRVRESHSDIDGEERPLGEEYSNGLLYPGDPSGEPEEMINCRCVEQYY
jgi:HK97 family phage portal protein